MDRTFESITYLIIDNYACIRIMSYSLSNTSRETSPSHVPPCLFFLWQCHSVYISLILDVSFTGLLLTPPKQ